MAWLDDWNALRGPQERVYISYDSTNKNSQAGDIGGTPKKIRACQFSIQPLPTTKTTT